MLLAPYCNHKHFQVFSGYIGQLAMHRFSKGWIQNCLKNMSDFQWAISSSHTLHSIPYLIIHYIGSKYLQKFNKAVSCLTQKIMWSLWWRLKLAHILTYKLRNLGQNMINFSSIQLICVSWNRSVEIFCYSNSDAKK